MAYRLVTRSDFDGLVCAALLEELGLIDDIVFVHPKDVQDGAIEITDRDITTNLPYSEGAHLVFDHHLSETLRVGPRSNYVIDADAPSAARVVWDYYGGAEAFPHISEEMMAAVDKADSAQYDIEEILHPVGWTLLNFLMDARTGLGRFRTFRVSNYELMRMLIPACRQMTVHEILALPDVAERVALYREHAAPFEAQLRRCSRLIGDVVVLDLREEEVIYAGNRFMIYALFPNAKVSVHVLWGKQQQNTVLAAGKSIVDRSSRANIGELMLCFGGGGHRNAGTCQVDHDMAEHILKVIVAALNATEHAPERAPTVTLTG
ncbi:MAG TPA: exopolyphosphatase [Euzebyales bacterium]|nr:exopolyphosphatase [Euzebyales bacterium]